MTGWYAVGALALGIATFFWTVGALDRYLNLREWQRREAKRMASRGRVRGGTDQRPDTPVPGRPARL